ncbi:MAG TPA: hypothetical protein VGJ84_17675, partial [Polyangiaceae bacterium]
DNARGYLEEHSAVLDRIEAAVLERHGLGRSSQKSGESTSEPTASPAKGSNKTPPKSSSAQAVKPSENGASSKRSAGTGM